MSALTVVLDIAWGRPTVEAIKAVAVRDSAGAVHHPVGVVRYFSTDDTKDLHTSEVPLYRAAGLGLATVYETTAGRATAGFAAGVADAKDAEVQRKQAGLDSDHVHHFAVDRDVPWSAVEPYFRGVWSVLGIRSGSYGSYRVTEGAHSIGIIHCWQTLAWSDGKVSAHATLYQSGGTVLSGVADINHALSADWGQTPRPTTTSEDDVFTPTDVKTLATTDGVFKAPADAADIKTNPYWTFASHVQDQTTRIRAIEKTSTALAATVKTLAGLVGKDVDTAAVVAAVEAAIAAAVVHVDVDVTGAATPAAAAPAAAPSS